MKLDLLGRSRTMLFLAPDGLEGPSSGGSSPQAQLPANQDTSGMQESGAHTMPSQADIAQLAQQYWEEEGRPEGRATDHWSRAEQTLRQQAGLT
jgi:hypothetical protein